MVNYVLIKKKGAKSYSGALKGRPGKTKEQIRKVVRSTIKPGYSFTVVSESELKTYLASQVKRPSVKRKVVKRKSAKRVVRRKRK